VAVDLILPVESTAAISLSDPLNGSFGCRVRAKRRFGQDDTPTVRFITGTIARRPHGTKKRPSKTKGVSISVKYLSPLAAAAVVVRRRFR